MIVVGAIATFDTFCVALAWGGGTLLIGVCVCGASTAPNSSPIG